MSLKITIVNGITQQTINAGAPHVLIDDTPSELKDKIFAFNPGFEYIPNLLSLSVQTSVGVDESMISILTNNALLFNFGVIPNEPEVFVTNLFQVIESQVNVVNLFNEMESSSEVVEQTLQQLRERGFMDLTEDDLEFVVKVNMLKMNPIVYDYLKRDIEDYITISNDKQKKVYLKYTSQENALSDYYKIISSTTDFAAFFDHNSGGLPVFNFSNVAFALRGKSFESGVRGRFINLPHVFNQFQLSDQIPFIALQTFATRDPLIKVYNKLLETVTQKEIRGWVLNEKKKRGIMSFKKIKGIMFKYKLPPLDTIHKTVANYMTISITDNGIIAAKISFEEEQLENDLDRIITFVKAGVDAVVENINQLQGVFYKSRRIENTRDSEIYIDGLSGSIITNFKVSKPQIINQLYREQIANYLFELKDTRSEEVLSMYYKKYGKRETDDVDSERKGLTVNIRDNPYRLDSSIINIYGAFSLNQITTILKQIIVLSLLHNDEVDDDRQKLKQKSHIKDLRKQGVNILSTKCQKPRQPSVADKKAVSKGSYVLKFNNMSYVCPSKEYPYPGFTNENIVCCFKKDQRRRPAYIRNVKSEDFDILVQPSNVKISVRETDSDQAYETFAIKVVSDYVDGFDESNSMSRYYFISNDNNLVAITNPSLVKRLQSEEENNIWLESMPLVKLTTEPPKNKCNFPPKLNNKSVDDINAPCLHHKRNHYFGYNLNSYPCCFDKPRDEAISRKRKEIDITKQHLLMTDKILDYQRIGVLPSGLDTLFNTIIKRNQNGKYYRMGVLQNTNAFFNAVLLACNNKIGFKTVNNSIELRKVLEQYLIQWPEEFHKLNSGNVALKYGSQTSYLQSLLNTQSEFYWSDAHDLIQRVTDTNIIILDIPYKTSDSTKVADYENIKLLCNPNIKYTIEQPFIVLLKRLKTFEVIIFMTNSKDTKDTSQDDSNHSFQRISYIFKYQPQGDMKSNMVNFLVDYYQSSCVKENVFPDTFPYQEMLNLTEVVARLEGTPHQIIAQVVNSFQKVEYVMTKRNISSDQRFRYCQRR